MLRYQPYLKSPARQLRNNMTNAEQRLWTRLRRKQIEDIQFYRQKPIGPYIVDFYAPSAHLVIEVDGAHHQQAEQANQDVARDAYLKGLRLTVLRFNNWQVLKELDAVVDEICRWTRRCEIPPNPPFSKGGDE